MSVDHDDSNESSEGVEQNGEVPEDQDPGLEEVELDTSASQKEPHLSNAITFGGLLSNGTGTDVDGYIAVNRGLNKFVQPKYFAMLLFAANQAKMPWVTTIVPQKVMCNSVFVVDLRCLDSESAIFRDGLGSWIQNCGKVANFFTYEDEEVKEIKAGSSTSSQSPVIEFVRRIDKNSSCPAYTRVTVISSQLGLAALQYFFKGEEEQTFTISYHRPKKIGSIIANSNQAAASFSGTRTRSQKRKNSAREDDEAQLSSQNSRLSVGKLNGEGKTSLSQSQSLSMFSPQKPPTLNAVRDPSDVSSTTLIAYLREHIRIDREDRAEDRKLRKEELDFQRKERQEDRKVQREDFELRKQELQLQKTKLNLDQQRWDIERKEKEAFLDLLKKKMADS